MKSFFLSVAFLANLTVILGSAIQGPAPSPFQYRNIRRIRPRQPRQSQLQEVDLIASPTLSVLSRLAQTQALRPRKRNINPRIDHQNPFLSESRVRPLPLEPPPQPLPLEELPKTSLATFQRNPTHDYVVYNPRPERGPHRGHWPPVQEPKRPDIQPQDPILPHHQEEPRHTFRPNLHQQPLAYVEDGTIYRKRLERPTLLDKPEEQSPIYSQNNPIFYQEKPTAEKHFPIRISKPPSPYAENPGSTFPRRTKHRNRPQFSGEHTDVRKPISHTPQPEEEFFTKLGAFESIREKEPTKTLFHPEKEEEGHHGTILKDSVFDKDHQWNSQTPSPEFTKSLPIKMLKKKKVTPHNIFQQPKDFKKDKRDILGEGHLDKNGVEFVQEAAKIEKENNDGRIAFQIHGQQGPHSYKFGYDTGKGHNRQFRYEERDGYGEVKGRYGYYDKYGKLQIVNYSAHPEHGFSADVPKY